MDFKERRYRLKRGLTADSGAGDPVIPKRMVNAKKIRPSPGSRRGLHYVSVTDHRIPNVGEISLELQTDEGHSEFFVFQVADVNKPFMSISDRLITDAGSCSTRTMTPESTYPTSTTRRLRRR